MMLEFSMPSDLYLSRGDPHLINRTFFNLPFSGLINEQICPLGNLITTHFKPVFSYWRFLFDIPGTYSTTPSYQPSRIPPRPLLGQNPLNKRLRLFHIRPSD